MTTLNTTLPASEARSNFYQLLNKAAQDFQQFTITLRGKASAIVMSAEEFAGWQETLEIISDRRLTQSIKKAIRSKKTYSQREANKIIGW